jgi:hypothetical protein
VQPWSADPVGKLETLRADVGAASGGLAPRLERDEAQLSALADDPALRWLLDRELRRLVHRHGGRDRQMTALISLATHELKDSTVFRSINGQRSFRPVPSMLVAQFLARECTGAAR